MSLHTRALPALIAAAVAITYAGTTLAQTATATPTATPSLCGNGTVNAAEECDDGGQVSDDGCSATCQLEDPGARCAGMPSFPGAAIASQLVATGLSGGPTHITAPPLDPSRLFIVEKNGIIDVIRNGVRSTFLNIDPKVNSTGNEQGLLSLAFHPSYESNGRFFVNYINAAGDSVLARYQVSGNLDVADASSEQILLTIDRPASNHNGGQLAFGPDGLLYWGMGDSGGSGDPDEVAQSTSSLLGKILRLDVDVDSAPFYSVPTSNPNANAGDPLGLIWARGLRNPWRFSFDRDTGDLYIADVGQDAQEEIDFQPASTTTMVNYGWDVFEGTACFDPAPLFPSCPNPPTGFTFPVHTYGHDVGCSITGGFVYRGCALPGLQGAYFYADFCSAFIRTLRVVGGAAQNHVDRTAALDPPGTAAINQITSFGEDARGEIYIADQGGQVYRIVPVASPTPSATPTVTRTRTASRTPTGTASPTRTRTRTSTRTFTQTPSATITRSPSTTRTPSRTLTTTPTRTSTNPLPPTVTPGPDDSPAGLAGLVLWLDATRLLNLAEGAAVTSWPDASAAAQTASQALAASRPTFRRTALNRQPAVRFDGVDDYLTIAASIVPGGQPRTVIVAARPDAIGNFGYVDLGDGNTTGGAFMLTPETSVRVAGGNRVWNQGPSTTALGILSVTMTAANTTALNAWLNGSPLPAAATVPLALNTSGNTSIGTFTSFPTGRYNLAGDIGDVIVYNRALSDGERAAVEAYLDAKYARPLPDPSTIANLVLWLDADRIPDADGSQISTWPDASGAAHSASQTTPTQRPTLHRGVVNGHAVVRFDGSDDFMNIAGTVVGGATARTVYVVARPNTVGNFGFVDLGDGAAAGTAFMLTPEYGVRVNGGNRLFATAASTNVAAILTVSSSASSTSSISAWLNGNSLGVAATGALTLNTVGSGVVGSFTAQTTGRYNLSGDIAEIIAYSRALSAQERVTVEEYLGNKYGITVP